ARKEVACEERSASSEGHRARRSSLYLVRRVGVHVARTSVTRTGPPLSHCYGGVFRAFAGTAAVPSAGAPSHLRDRDMIDSTTGAQRTIARRPGIDRRAHGPCRAAPGTTTRRCQNDAQCTSLTRVRRGIPPSHPA